MGKCWLYMYPLFGHWWSNCWSVSPLVQWEAHTLESQVGHEIKCQLLPTFQAQVWACKSHYIFKRWESTWLLKWASSPHIVYIVGQNSFCIRPLKVLSSSVSKGLELTGGSEVEETAKFTATFDKFFDALNVRNVSDECTKGSHSSYPTIPKMIVA